MTVMTEGCTLGANKPKPVMMPQSRLAIGGDPSDVESEDEDDESSLDSGTESKSDGQADKDAG